MKRTAIKRRRSKPRRGRIYDPTYLAWIHTQPCAVTGRMPVTAHHVRRHGEPKSDRRTIPLVAEAHLYDAGPYSIERLGKRKFEAHFGVGLELLILGYQRRYEQEWAGVA